MKMILAVILGVATLLLIQPCSGEQLVNIGDSAFGIGLSVADGALHERQCDAFGSKVLDYDGAPWSLETDSGIITPGSGECRIVHSNSQSALFEGESAGISWRLSYELTGRGMITKSLTLTPSKMMLLKRISLWSARSAVDPIVAQTSLQDIAAFYRNGNRGVFVSLDFPYSDIAKKDGLLTVSYPPFEKINPGETLTCHSLTVGVTRLTGHSSYDYDDGEVDAMDSYIQNRFKPRFERPMFISTCINNRYTQLGGGAVFYTMKDHPTLSFNPELLKREMTLLPKLGMEYYQVWTGPFDSVPDDPDPAYVKNVVAFGNKIGLRLGDYSGCNSVFCGHYNEYCKTLADYPEWHLTNSDACFGNPKFVDFYASQVVANCKKYGFQIHCLDFLNIQPCDNPNHGHPIGRESVYAQISGLVRVLKGLNSVSPDMMTWSNSGNWSQFLPKIAWWNENLYLTDPCISNPWQGLNMTRLLDDARREQMVSLHYSTFVPYRYLSNCQYFFCQNSIVPDIRNFEYGALSTIAVTPNLTLGEVRPWYDSLSAADQERVQSFYKHWTDFLKTNFQLWKKTYCVGERPGAGSVEIYGHASGSSGFVFIVNPNYWGRTVEVPLGARLGFSGKGNVEIKELYPTQQLRLTAQGPFASLGTTVPFYVEPQQVVVLQISPAPANITKSRLYGLPGSVDVQGDGYVLKTTGLQGVSRRCTILFPQGSKSVLSAKTRPDVPKQPKRLWSATPVNIVETSPESLTLDITFRRDPALGELRNWRARPCDLATGLSGGFPNGVADAAEMYFPLFVDVDDASVKLPMWDSNADSADLGPLANFCGAYIDNAFQEEQETWIDLETTGAPLSKPGEIGSDKSLPSIAPLSSEAKSRNGNWWLQTSFHLPFMYWAGGSEPRFEDHTILVLPFIRKDQVTTIKAWINGVPLDVRDYRYPRNRGLGCFYVDLVGTAAHGGENTVVVYFDASPKQ